MYPNNEEKGVLHENNSISEGSYEEKNTETKGFFTSVHYCKIQLTPSNYKSRAKHTVASWYLPKRALNLLHFLHHILCGQKNNICFQFCLVNTYLVNQIFRKMDLSDMI